MSPNPNLSVGSVQPHHSCVYITMEFDALAQISILESPLWPSTPPDHVGFGAAPAWHNIYGYLMWTYVLDLKLKAKRIKIKNAKWEWKKQEQRQRSNYAPNKNMKGQSRGPLSHMGWGCNSLPKGFVWESFLCKMSLGTTYYIHITMISLSYQSIHRFLSFIDLNY